VGTSLGAHFAFLTLYRYNWRNNKEVILATTVYDILDLELQDGTEVQVRPVDLKRLRKIMTIIEEMNEVVSEENDGEGSEGSDSPVMDKDTDNLTFLIKATKVCLEKQVPDLVKNDDAFEEALDIPTMWKILEVAAGISSGSNFQTGAALPGLI
jgi:hypothetical protein